MALRLNSVFILAVICSIQICSAAILSKSYSHNDIHITLPLLFNEYDDVLSQYDRAKYLYPSSFALDDDNNIYIQYIFEPKQKDNILVCYNKKEITLGTIRYQVVGEAGLAKVWLLYKTIMGLMLYMSFRIREPCKDIIW